MIAKTNYLLGVDLETTGVDFEHDFVLEIAAVALDERLNTLGRFGSLVTEAATYGHLEAQLDPKVREWHEKSGLLAEVRREYERAQRSTTPQLVEMRLLEFLRRMGMRPGEIMLIGYSVQFDKRMIERALPLFDWACSYQILEVGSGRRIFNLADFGLKKPDAGAAHRASVDIEAAIDELRRLRDFARIAKRFAPQAVS